MLTFFFFLPSVELLLTLLADLQDFVHCGSSHYCLSWSIKFECKKDMYELTFHYSLVAISISIFQGLGALSLKSVHSKCMCTRPNKTHSGIIIINHNYVPRGFDLWILIPRLRFCWSTYLYS